MISCFEHIKNPLVVKEIDIYELIEQIKQPEPPVLDLISKARLYYGRSKHLYNFHKLQLPCFTLNFSFNHKKANVNIKAPTGLIYLDLDNETDINLNNELIFVSWKSISNNGRGILVKVNGLTIDNFKNTYLSIAKELNIQADKQAIKPTQSCFHSYDKDVYVNNNSITYQCKEYIKSSPNKDIYLKEKRKDSTEMGEYNKIRFNNIDDYDFKGKDYLYFEDDKINIASVFIPKIIKQGGRNNIISSIAYQIKSLNKNIRFDDFYRLMVSINYTHCRPVLNDDEIEKIIVSVFNNKNLEPILNEEKRFLFNPKKNLSHKDKMKIIAPIMGKRKSEETISEIREVLNNWNVYKHGKVTQKSLQKATGKNIKTIEKYYSLFKCLRTKINNDLKVLASQ